MHVTDTDSEIINNTFPIKKQSFYFDHYVIFGFPESLRLKIKTFRHELTKLFQIALCISEFLIIISESPDKAPVTRVTCKTTF